MFCPTDSDDEEEEDEDIKTGFKPQVILEPKVDLTSNNEKLSKFKFNFYLFQTHFHSLHILY